MEFLTKPGWIFFALLFLGLIFVAAWRRWRDRKWIRDRFGEANVLIQSFGVKYFGRMLEPGRPRAETGYLVLLSDRLFFRSPRTGTQLEIPRSAVTRLYHGVEHKGVDLHQSVIKIDFTSEAGEKDVAAFHVPYPPQWMQAIGATFGLIPERKKNGPASS